MEDTDSLQLRMRKARLRASGVSIIWASLLISLDSRGPVVEAGRHCCEVSQIHMQGAEGVNTSLCDTLSSLVVQYLLFCENPVSYLLL